MGGHGGLNILPQKRWNVYNFDNREKVRKDEEAAAREEHIRQQQERQKESEARLAKLRDATLAKQKGKAIDDETLTDEAEALNNAGVKYALQEDEIQHMKLFNGLISFKKLNPGFVHSEEYKSPNEVDKKIFRGDKELERLYKRAAKEATRVGKDGAEADNEHYKLGYGCLDRNKKRPWYLMKGSLQLESDIDTKTTLDRSGEGGEKKQKKKTIAELRDERLKREQHERERARKIVTTHQVGQHKTIESSERNRRPYYNSGFGHAR